jgi:ubiquitin carboxyl-terminal hydrolase 7
MSISEYATLYAEKIPEDELNATEDDRAIFCFHFDKEPTKPHGIPFKFVLKPSEPFKETRERLSKRTCIKGKLLEKIKFAIVSRSLYTKPRYLEDGTSYPFPHFPFTTPHTPSPPRHLLF